MSNQYIARIAVKEIEGRAVLSTMEVISVGSKTTRVKVVEGAESIRMVLCSRITWVVDLSHVGYTLIEALATKKVAPQAIITEKGTILRIIGYGNTEIRNASAIASGCGDILKLKEIFRALGIGKSKADPLTISGVSRRIMADLLDDMKAEINGDIISNDTYKKIRAAYRGGIMYQKPGVYREPGAAYDINSLYPWAMISSQMPIGIAHKTPEECVYPYGFFKVSFEATFKGVGIDWLPLVIKTIRCTGQGSYRCYPLWMTETDLKELKKDYVLLCPKVYDRLYFESVPGSELFGPFVGYYYELKSIKTGTERDAAKMVLNSACGSFGRSSVTYSKVPYMDAGTVKYKYTVSEDTKKNRESGYIPIAAAITAYGRARLLEDIRDVGGDAVIYANTDSLALIGNAAPLDIGSQIGQYKLECNFDTAKVFGANSYVFIDGSRGAKISLPGVTKADRKRMTLAEKAAIMPGNEINTTRWVKVPGGKVQRQVKIIVGGI